MVMYFKNYQIDWTIQIFNTFMEALSNYKKNSQIFEAIATKFFFFLENENYSHSFKAKLT